jgi:D-glycero-alpha-D-manno-heptose-7-phosphate kinase
MILTRSPLRISLGGGGTDLPSYYEEFEGFLISAAINKYVYVTVSRPFSEEILLKYSKLERCKNVLEIEHPIIREALSIFELKTPQIEITTIADIPSGTGLGSSGSFTTALLKALYTHYKKTIHPRELAELACKIEIEKLGEPIGKQDQYISAFGGITEFQFKKNGLVESAPLGITMQTLHKLEDNLMLFFTGISRSASAILADQHNKSIVNDRKMLENLHFTKQLGLESKKALINNDTFKFGQLLHEHWIHKKERSTGITNDFVNEVYSIATKNGAVGGKIVGAGGGGFLLFYCSDKEKLRNEMKKFHLDEIRFQFDFEGTKVILSQ